MTERLQELGVELGELLASRAEGQRALDYSRYASDPVAFLREVLGAEPWSRQVEIAEAVRAESLVTVRSANSVGKDWLAARLALWWYATRPGSTVLVTGPTERQVKEIVFGREIAGAFRHSALPGNLFATALRGPEERLILGFTSSESSRLTGFHAPGGILVVITEGQGVEPFAYEAMLSCATGEHDRLLVVGNPLSPEGDFYRIHRPDSDWKAFAIPATDHPNVVEDRTAIPGAVTRTFVERIRRQYGADSPQYVSRVLAEFPQDAEFGLASRAWLEAAFDRFKGATYPSGMEIKP